LFRFYTETESFHVSIEPKQTEDQPKKFDREHILIFFSENFGVFCLFLFVLVCFEKVCLDVSIEPKQTEDQLKQFDREHIWYFSENVGLFWFVSVCFETVLFVLIVSIKVRNTEINQNNPKFLVS
jgi:hypothetical protein